MIAVRDRRTRGHADMGGRDGRHAFSSGTCRDPRQMGFGGEGAIAIDDDRRAGVPLFDLE